MAEEPYNAGDAEQVKERARTAKQKAQARDRALAQLMGTKDGRSLVWDLLSECGIYRTSFAPAAPGMTEFNEGKRSIGLSLLASVHRLCPEQYPVMVTENAG